jgi:cytochrome c-type biogenesis protein CcmE
MTGASGISRRSVLFRRRVALVAATCGVFGLAVILLLFALSDSVTFFYSPSDLREKKVAAGQRINLGGLVETGSVDKRETGVVRFAVTDGAARTMVQYRGVLPDLFREGQGVVATGRLEGAEFQATAVLAKHDENYMPPEVAKALKARGVWKEGDPAPHPSAAERIPALTADRPQ